MATLDSTTTSEYSAELNAVDRAQLIVDNFTAPVTVKVYNDSSQVVGTGLLSTPWATRVGSTVVFGDVTGFSVTVSGTPNSNWYLRFESGTRYIQFTFGLAGSGKEAVWSLDNWTAGTQAGIRNSALTCSGNVAPVFTNAPATLSFTQGVGGTYDFSAKASDADGDTLTYTVSPTYTGITIPDGVLTVSSAAAAGVRSLTIRAADPAGLYAETNCDVTIQVASARVVYYNGAFSSAGVPSRTSLDGGGYVGCKYEPEGGVDTFFTNSGSPSDPVTASGRDCRVLTSETWNGDLITARAGTHFMRQAIYYDKQYECLNNVTTDNPRVKFDQYNAVYGFDWDTELWFGFSLRLSDSYIPDVATKSHAGGSMIWVINTGSTADGTQITLSRFCPPGDTVEKWMIRYQLNANSVADMGGNEGANTIYVDLGSTTPDIGKWTDFVIRARFNPFAVATNPGAAGIANAVNRLYQGNRGILQVWKGTGSVDSNGNRTMSRVYSRVNLPVGGVPDSRYKLYPSHRIYKYGWKKNATTSTAPIYQAFDEIRWGFGESAMALSKGQSRASISSDVSPSGEVLT